jgi:RNA polymerase sigma factor (TIGR02999 family)
MERTNDVTEILNALGAGDNGAADRLFEVVYGELRDIARSLMAGERRDHTLQPTAIVHEAYMRLVGPQATRWENRAHFFSAAAEAMRRVLIDHARRKLTLKRGGDQRRVELADMAAPDLPLAELLAVDQAIDKLEKLDPAMANVVKLRYFAGLSVEETAEVTEMSTRSVNRAWTGARAWLRRELTSLSPAPGRTAPK